MPRGVIQFSITDAAGNVVPEASVEVRNSDTLSLVGLWEQRSGGDALGNPAQADEDGYFRAYCNPQRVNIKATLGEFERTWMDVEVMSSGMDLPETATNSDLPIPSILPGGDIQAFIDSYPNRAVALQLRKGIYQFTQPLIIGQNTTILGTNSSLPAQPESDASWVYSPHQVLDFSSDDIDGIESDPNSSYRVMHPRFYQLTLIGSGDDNGKTGVKMSTNASNTKTGFFTLDNVYVMDFEIGADGFGVADGARFIDCHFNRVKTGIQGVGTEVWIRACTFWNFTETGGMAIQVQGKRALISENEFEMGGGTGAVSTDCVVVNGEYGKVQFNHFKFSYKRGVVYGLTSGSGLGIVSHNSFEGVIEEEAVYLGEFGTHTIISDNTFNPSAYGDRLIYAGANDSIIANNSFARMTTASDNKDIIVVNANRVVITGNTFQGLASSNPNSYVNVMAGSTDTWIEGPLRVANKIIDNGTRTVINGRSKNAGNPNSTGQWNGLGALAFERGVLVYDTTNNILYSGLPGGGFVVVATV